MDDRSVIADAFEKAVSVVLECAIETVMLRMQLEQKKLSRELEEMDKKTVPAPARKLGVRVKKDTPSNGTGKVIAAAKSKDPFLATKDLRSEDLTM